jgi:hypothetical protein
MRREWASAVRSRWSGDGGPYALLTPAALDEAAELFASTSDPQDVPETCYLVGMLLWQRAASLLAEDAEQEMRAAITLLHVVHLTGADFTLPEPLRESFSQNSYPGMPFSEDAGPGTLWDPLIAALDVWLDTGGDPCRLRLAVGAARNAVNDSTGLGRRVRYLAFLGKAWIRLFESTGDTAALKEATAATRAAVTEAAEEDPDRPMIMCNLAESLRIRHEHTGDVKALHEAVDLGRSALRHTPEGDGRRYLPLATLSLSLRELYDRTCEPVLLDEATRTAAAALNAAPDGHALPAAFHVNYAGVLQRKFERTGDPAVLNRAIAAARQASRTAAERTPLQRACLYNLSSLLHRQFELTGDMPALDEALGACRTAVRATQLGHPDAPLYRSSLVGQLKDRFRRTGEVAALDEAIAWGQAAWEATPPDHPNAMMYLSNLALALKAKAEHTGELPALRDAIEMQRQAARMAAEAGRDPSPLLTNLVSSLLRYFEHTSETAALDEAIAAGRAAVTAAPEDHSGRSLHEINLALVLSTRGLATGDHHMVDEAISLLEAAAVRSSARTAARVHAAGEWGRLAMHTGQTERAARGYALAVQLLPRLASRGLIRADATHWLAEHSELAADAAACAVRTGRADHAVELLEAGRGVLLAQTLESRTDLTDLEENHAKLADRFSYLCARLDADATTEADPAGNAADQRREFAEELSGMVAHIRTLPGLGGFLQPPEAAQLSAEAHGGPIAVINISRYGCHAFILTTDGVQAQELPALDYPTVHDQLAMMRNALKRVDCSEAERHKAENALHSILAWLWDAVTGPVLERLGMTSSPQDVTAWPRIWWVPCGPLAYFPLHAAGHHLEEAPDSRTRRTVMDRVISSYAPTVRTLAHARTRQERPKHTSSAPPRVLAVAMPYTPGAPDLPGAQREFRQLAELFPGTEGLVGKNATRDAVLIRLPTTPWVHFACHAGTDPADPSRSHLLVHDHDHKRLSVLDISRLRLEDSEFAYLSACSTAVTAPELVDESIHVVTAFQLAGYSHVVGTLWEVDDRVGSEIAEHVYASLASCGSDATTAGTCVHHATRLIRQRYPHIPTLWAAHIHTGP